MKKLLIGLLGLLLSGSAFANFLTMTIPADGKSYHVLAVTSDTHFDAACYIASPLNSQGEDIPIQINGSNMILSSGSAAYFGSFLISHDVASRPEFRGITGPNLSGDISIINNDTNKDPNVSTITVSCGYTSYR